MKNLIAHLLELRKNNMYNGIYIVEGKVIFASQSDAVKGIVLYIVKSIEDLLDSAIAKSTGHTGPSQSNNNVELNREISIREHELEKITKKYEVAKDKSEMLKEKIDDKRPKSNSKDQMNMSSYKDEIDKNVELLESLQNELKFIEDYGADKTIKVPPEFSKYEKFFRPSQLAIYHRTTSNKINKTNNNIKYFQKKYDEAKSKVDVQIVKFESINELQVKYIESVDDATDLKNQIDNIVGEINELKDGLTLERTDVEYAKSDFKKLTALKQILFPALYEDEEIRKLIEYAFKNIGRSFNDFAREPTIYQDMMFNGVFNGLVKYPLNIDFKKWYNDPVRSVENYIGGVVSNLAKKTVKYVFREKKTHTSDELVTQNLEEDYSLKNQIVHKDTEFDYLQDMLKKSRTYLKSNVDDITHNSIKMIRQVLPQDPLSGYSVKYEGGIPRGYYKDGTNVQIINKAIDNFIGALDKNVFDLKSKMLFNVVSNVINDDPSRPIKTKIIIATIMIEMIDFLKKHAKLDLTDGNLDEYERIKSESINEALNQKLDDIASVYHRMLGRFETLKLGSVEDDDQSVRDFLPPIDMVSKLRKTYVKADLPDLHKRLERLEDLNEGGADADGAQFSNSISYGPRTFTVQKEASKIIRFTMELLND